MFVWNGCFSRIDHALQILRIIRDIIVRYADNIPRAWQTGKNSAVDIMQKKFMQMQDWF